MAPDFGGSNVLRGCYAKELCAMVELFGLSRFRGSFPANVYDAFISHSHAKDKIVAVALQRVIQTLGRITERFFVEKHDPVPLKGRRRASCAAIHC